MSIVEKHDKTAFFQLVIDNAKTFITNLYVNGQRKTQISQSEYPKFQAVIFSSFCHYPLRKGKNFTASRICAQSSKLITKLEQ